MEVREQVLAALKQLQTGTPVEIAAKAGVERYIAGRHLRDLLAEGKIKSSGKGRGLRYGVSDNALAHDQETDTPAPPARQKKKRKGAKKRKAGTARKRAEKASTFIPALTAKNELVCVGRNDGEAPILFNPEQTLAIAALCQTHFE